MLLDDFGPDLSRRRDAGQTQRERRCGEYADAT
jgi:hypothetical protein